MKNLRYLTQHDAVSLNRLAEELLHLDGREIDAAEQLLDVVATSTLLPFGRRKDCVSLNSTVTYAHLACDTAQTIALVHPHDADPSTSRISVLTPIGLALLGRKRTSIVDVTLPSGRIDKIRIVDIVHHDPDANGNDAS